MIKELFSESLVKWLHVKQKKQRSTVNTLHTGASSVKTHVFHLKMHLFLYDNLHMSAVFENADVTMCSREGS